MDHASLVWKLLSIKFSISGSLRVLSIVFSDEPVIHRNWEKRPIRLSSPSQKISRGLFPVIHFPLPCSILVLNDFCNGTLHQSKRPTGALSQSKSLHLRKEYSDIKPCYTTCLSQWSPTSSLPICPSAPPDARKKHYLSSSLTLSFPFIIFYSLFVSEHFYAFICISDPYHHGN